MLTARLFAGIDSQQDLMGGPVMQDDDGKQAMLIELSASIVSAYVVKNSVPSTELPALIASAHAALSKLGAAPEPEPAKREPPVPIRRSITRDALISLEDGRPYKTLKRHLAKLGLTPEAYRQKWGLPLDYPMVAASYAEQRSNLAKSLGLGQIRRNRAAAAAAAAEAPTEAPAPKRAGRGRPRKAPA
jgi:predicted transcriptional regulator